MPVACSLPSGLNDLTGLQAAAANPQPFRPAPNLGLHRVQIHIPAAPGDVVRVRDVVPKLRTFAANIANLCHVFSNRNDSCSRMRRKLRALAARPVKSGRIFTPKGNPTLSLPGTLSEDKHSRSILCGVFANWPAGRRSTQRGGQNDPRNPLRSGHGSIPL